MIFNHSLISDIASLLVKSVVQQPRASPDFLSKIAQYLASFRVPITRNKTVDSTAQNSMGRQDRSTFFMDQAPTEQSKTNHTNI